MQPLNFCFIINLTNSATDSVVPSNNGNDKNIYYGNGNAPSFDKNAITADPMFVDIAHNNFQ